MKSVRPLSPLVDIWSESAIFYSFELFIVNVRDVLRFLNDIFIRFLLVDDKFIVIFIYLSFCFGLKKVSDSNNIGGPLC